MLDSKKGSIALPIQNVVGIILGIMGVIVLFAVFFSLMKMFINPPSAGSTKSLQDFHNIVEAMLSPDNKNTSCYWTVMFVEQNWAIAGFNKNGVTSKTTDITCSTGGDCIEERCCNTYCNDIKKPKSCGSGPCTCLCRTCSASVGGSCVGSLGGDDCSERGSVCKPIVGTPLTRFYYVDHAYCTRTTGQAVGAVKGRLKQGWNALTGGDTTYKNENDFDKCDLVYDSESCGVGAKKGIQRLITISRSSDYSIINFETWSSKSKMRKDFPNAVDCKKMMRDLKKKPEVKYTVEKVDKGTKITTHLNIQKKK